MSMSQIMKMLESIKAGQVKLVGVSPLVSGGGFFSNNYAEGIEPVIKKDSQQW